jgi:hypothetical protein
MILLFDEAGHFACSQKRTFSLAKKTSGLAVYRPEGPSGAALGFLAPDLSMGAIFVINIFLFFYLTELLRYRNIAS